MKKHYIFKFTLLLIPVSALTLLSFSSGRDNAYSGSPGDAGTNCTQCHTGTAASSSNVSIITDIPASGYASSTEYNITITNSDPNSRNGFQVTAENASNSKIGSFSTGGSADVQTKNNNQRVTHTSSGTSKSSWTFKWTSPASGQGNVTFYGASVSGNGSGSGGDKVYLGSSQPIPSLSISEANRLDFDMYPNPASENLTIQLSSGSDKATVQFYDYLGKLALTSEVTATNNKIDVNNLSSGVYVLKVLSDDKIGIQKFIKN